MKIRFCLSVKSEPPKSKSILLSWIIPKVMTWCSLENIWKSWCIIVFPIETWIETVPNVVWISPPTPTAVVLFVLSMEKCEISNLSNKDKAIQLKVAPLSTRLWILWPKICTLTVFLSKVMTWWIKWELFFDRLYCLNFFRHWGAYAYPKNAG